jgi:hypothetical protein
MLVVSAKPTRRKKMQNYTVELDNIADLERLANVFDDMGLAIETTIERGEIAELILPLQPNNPFSYISFTARDLLS